MNYSTNYSMREPVPGEKVKVADINYNTEIIDGVMLDNRQISLEMYRDNETYNENRVVGHENAQGRIRAYRCLEDGTTGAWDDTKWVQTNISDELEDIRENAGASDLGDLSDVEITTPTDGQALLYDPTSSKWHNSDLPDADVTKEASGNPIEFTDGADAPLVKCVTQITGSQDLHGQDKPWPPGAGKNKLPLTVDGIKAKNTSGTWNGNVYTKNNGTFEIVTDNGNNVTGIKVRGTFNAQTLFEIGNYISDSTTSIIYNGVSGGSAETYSININIGGQYQGDIYDGDSPSRQIPASTNCYYLIVIRENYVANDVMFYPMFRLATETDPTFAPYSNICPITAYTEGKIMERGKNLLNNADAEIGTAWNGGSNSARARLVVKKDPYTPYVISMNGTNGMDAIYVKRYSSVPASDAGIQITSFPVTISATDDNTFLIFAFSKTAISQTDVDNLKLQVEKGSTPTTYEPYKGTTHTTTYPSAIYRGSEDCVNGKVTSNMPMIDLGDLTWSKNSGNNVFYTESLVNTIKKPAQSTDIANIVCECFETRSANSVQGANDGIGVGASGIIVVYDSTKISMSSSDFATAVTGVKLAYELSTPTTSSVTPTNLPIKSLSGYNHIESTTGDMEIEYFPQKEQPLIDLIPEASNMHTYSTAEHAVGTWIDGETIYEQTYNYTGTGAANPFQTTIDMTGKNLLEVIPHYARYTYNSGQSYGECIGSEMLYNGSSVLNIRYVDSVPYTLTVTSGLGSTDSYDIAFTLRYTKTASNNRSLAKSAPTEEIKEEQVEELKEEPTEETKEEPVEEVKEEVKEEETKEEGEVNER